MKPFVKFSSRLARTIISFVLLFSLILNSLFLIPASVYAASSPWTQTNWNGGSGQTSWSDTTKYSSGSSVTTSTANQITLTNSEKLSNTGFESNLSSWYTGVQPDSISGLKLWLKADAITGSNDGDSVTTWTDSSGNTNNATQSTAANKPTYKTNIINGNPVVRFDGVDDNLITTSTLYSNITSAATLTIFGIFEVHTAEDTNSHTIIVSKDNYVASNFRLTVDTSEGPPNCPGCGASNKWGGFFSERRYRYSATYYWSYCYSWNLCSIWNETYG